MYNCTVQSEAHVWRISSITPSHRSVLPRNLVIMIARETPVSIEDNYEFRLVEDKSDALITSLTILLVTSKHNHLPVSCDDALNPGQGKRERTRVNVVGKSKLT